MFGWLYRLIFLATMLLIGKTFFSEIFAGGISDIAIPEFYKKKQSKYLNNGTMESITFESKKSIDECQGKITRNGILFKRINARGTVLISHGFMCNKDDTGFLRLLFPTHNVMTFDFRAHGDNICEKQICTFGRDEAFDVQAAVGYLRSREDLDLKNKPLIGYGFSMGAVASIQAQSSEASLFDLLILDCPYDHSENVIKKCMESLKFSFFGFEFSLPGKSLLEKYAFHPFVQRIVKVLLKTISHIDATATNTFIYPLSPADSVKKINIPCFFIHCINDEKVAVEAAKNLFNNAGGYKRLWFTDGRRHFDSFFYNPEKYIYKVNKFVDDVLAKKHLHKKQAKIVEDFTIKEKVKGV